MASAVAPTMRTYSANPSHPLSPVLAGMWVLLIAYASLYPLSGWRVPPGADVLALLHLPWQRWIPGFDAASNLLGYVPLGLLLTFAARPQRGSLWWSAATAALMAAALSYSMEVLQQFVPMRVPSALDWLLNCAGAALGAALAVLLDSMGWPLRWRWQHDRWLERGGRGAAALLLLWPIGLLFPAPLPFALGQVGVPVRDLVTGLFDGLTWFEPLRAWIDAGDAPSAAVSLQLESGVAVLGLLAPCLLAYSASAPSWRRIWLGLGAPVMAAAAVTLSTALNFGPEHALAWRTPSVTAAMLLAAALALGLSWIGPRLASALALVVLTSMVVLVHLAPADPYLAQSLQAWEQGHFIRFHGLAQWVGWLWPYAAMAWLLARTGAPR